MRSTNRPVKQLMQTRRAQHLHPSTLHPSAFPPSTFTPKQKPRCCLAGRGKYEGMTGGGYGMIGRWANSTPICARQTSRTRRSAFSCSGRSRKGRRYGTGKGWPCCGISADADLLMRNAGLPKKMRTRWDFDRFCKTTSALTYTPSPFVAVCFCFALALNCFLVDFLSSPQPPSGAHCRMQEQSLSGIHHSVLNCGAREKLSEETFLFWQWFGITRASDPPDTFFCGLEKSVSSCGCNFAAFNPRSNAYR